MKRRADVFFLPENAQSMPPSDADLYGVNAGRLHEEKTDFVCPGGQVKKLSNHVYPVTAVTDGDEFTLILCSHSASSIFEFVTGSSSGEIQVDSRPSLNRANFPGRNRELKNCMLPKTAANIGPHREQEFSESIKCRKHCVLIHSQLSENGHQRVSGFTCFRQ